MIVADASLLAAMILRGDRSADAERVLARDAEWIAPALWRSEFVSVLLKYVRAGTLTLSEAVEHVGQARRLVHDDVVVDHVEVLRLAAGSGASTYDSEYVLVSRVAGVPLVTADTRLAARFPGTAVLLADFAAS